MRYEPGRGTATGEGDLGGLGWGAETSENGRSDNYDKQPFHGTQRTPRYLRRAAVNGHQQPFVKLP